MPLAHGVGNQDKRDAGDLPYRLPTLLAIDHAFRLAEYEWIFENTASGLKAEAVFTPIGVVLGLVPLESHSDLMCATA